MDRLDKKILIEMALYILEITGGVDIYHLCKVLYFGQRRHLGTYGIPLVADDFHALPYGPVPTNLYDFFKKGDHDFQNVIKKGSQDAQCILFGKRNADRNYLSEADRETLDEVIKEYASLPFEVLKQKSHDEYWKRASEGNSKVMPLIDIARSAKASDGMIEYLEEHLAVELALS